MISLFLNTSSNYLDIAILQDDKIKGVLHEKLDKDISKVAVSNIKEMMDDLGYVPNDIDNVVCVNGPGSFTGLRVGVTIAKTYCYSLNKDLYSVSSLYVMATSVKDSDYIIPIIDARRNFVYAAIYDKNYNIVMEESYIGINKLIEIANELDGKKVYVSNDSFTLLDTQKPVPDIENTYRFKKFKKEDCFKMVPNYLKRSEAEEKVLNDKTN